MIRRHAVTVGIRHILHVKIVCDSLENPPHELRRRQVQFAVLEQGKSVVDPTDGSPRILDTLKRV